MSAGLYTIVNSFIRLRDKHPIVYNLVLAIVFGLLSLFLGMADIGFSINPELQINVDLREIILIISTFFVSNPLYVIITVALATISEDLAGWDKIDFFMHLVPLMSSFYLYRKLPAITSKSHLQGLIWFGFIFVYYFVLLLPSLVIGYKLSGYTIVILEEYLRLSRSIIFELLATGMATAFFVAYLSLFDWAGKLKAINTDLENRLHKRTEVIEVQLKQMLRYAHMNSHELRAPLARVLGLLEILKLEEDPLTVEAIMKMLQESGDELDQIVQKMNRLLEVEVMERELRENRDG